MKKRAEKDIWNGLFDFMLIEKQKPIKAEKIFADPEFTRLFKGTDTIGISKPYKHILTHQTILCRFIHLKASPSFSIEGNGVSFFSKKQIERLPKPVLISRFLNDQNQP